MYALAIFAFAAGLVLGIFFRALAVLALAIVFVLGLMIFGKGSGIPLLTGSVVFTVLVNIGYMAGALLFCRQHGSSDADLTDK